MFLQEYGAGIVLGLVLCELLGANILADLGVNRSLTRRLAGMLGGGAFLVAVALLDAATAVSLSVALTLVILILRFGFHRGLRGLGSEATARHWGELAYLIAGTAGLAVGWGLLGDRWLAFVPIAFMAWGDNVAGLVRETVLQGDTRSIWPSVAMLAACLAVAAFFQPYWIAALGAMTATAVERFGPGNLPFWDDNWVIVPSSLGVMALVATFSG